MRKKKEKAPKPTPVLPLDALRHRVVGDGQQAQENVFCKAKARTG